MRLLRKTDRQQERRQAAAAHRERPRDNRQKTKGSTDENEPGGEDVRAGRPGPQRVPVRIESDRQHRQRTPGRVGRHGRAEPRIAHSIWLHYVCVLHRRLC